MCVSVCVVCVRAHVHRSSYALLILLHLVSPLTSGLRLMHASAEIRTPFSKASR